MGDAKKGNGFRARSTAEQVSEGVDGSVLTAIVTGSTNGIGKETVRVFAKRGVHVFLAVRNLESAGKVKEDILKETPEAKVDFLKLDTSSLESVRKAADEFLGLNLPLNILVCNAGIMFVPFQLTKDGIERQFETNYLGHFLLTNLLLDKLKTTAKESGIEGKIINVSSDGHSSFEYKGGIRFENLNDKDGYSPYKAYGQSKLAQILTTTELSRHLQEEGAKVTVNALHPGVVTTNLVNPENHGIFMRGIMKVVMTVVSTKNVGQGAATTVYLALNPQAAGVTGKYYSDANEYDTPSKFAKDADLAKKLWDFSVQLTAP
jgi:NAD(P)-dependent dehydrogenase (short-subunit alcohol dehydrogenase family)